MPISFSPYVSTNAAGSFYVESDGLIQGTVQPDPAVRYYLVGGWVGTTETVPMYGGIAIQESIPNEQPATPPLRQDVSLGNIITRSTANANILGFTVFDQNYAAINSPQSPVPLADIGQRIHYHRLGSGARIALAITPALVSLEGGLTNQAIGWDFTNQIIIAGSGFPGKILSIKSVNCMTVTYTAATGFATWNRNAACAVCLI
jgi:hypothetical protein